MWWRGKKFKPAALGQVGEQWAQSEYRKRGFTIVARNEINRRGKQAGEIDFIATDKNSIVFVEVKTRLVESGKFGTVLESVNIFKQQKLLKAAKLFLLRNPKYRSLRPQIDVCAVVVANLDKSQYSVRIIANAVEDETR